MHSDSRTPNPVSKHETMKEPPGCIRKNVYNHACGDCDDQATVPVGGFGM